MPKAIIVGAGVGGLASALTLSRSGFEVDLYERDATAMPADATAAFAWVRDGAPQVRHSHAFLARLRNLLRDHHPDVLEALFAAGATEIRFCDLLPEEMTDREARPGDDDLVALACRRTTFEWVLRRCALDSARVRLHHGVAVHSLLADQGRTATVPKVIGVTTDDGPQHADVIIVANGRRSTVPAWLDQLGVHVREDIEETGIVYLSRFYRLDPDSEPPEVQGPIGGDLGYLKFGVFQGDDRTFSVTLAVGTDDRELRRLLSDPATFDAAAATCEPTAPWLARAGARLTEVQTMAGLLNRRRHFLDDHGEPLALGVHVVGDAHTASNPLYGRGCSLAFVMAQELAAALANAHGDAHVAAVTYENAVEREVTPWYQASVTSDRQARAYAAWVRAHAGDPEADPSTEPDVAAIALLRDGFLPAVRTDPHVFRVFLRTFNLLDAPEQAMTDSLVMARVMQCYQEREQRPEPAALGPNRAGMLAAIGVEN